MSSATPYRDEAPRDAQRGSGGAVLPASGLLRTAAAVALLVAAVLAVSVLVEHRGERLAASLIAADGAAPAAAPEPVIGLHLLRPALGTAGLALALGGMLPAALLLFGGPRKWVLVSAFVLWSAVSGAVLAVLWSWTRLPQ